jgi:ketosteroid isomerase-like protein
MRGPDRLVAELSCMQVINRYATAVDAVDLDLLRTCFFDDVEASYAGQPLPAGIEPIVELIAPLTSAHGTIHNLGPLHVTARGSQAHATAGCLVLAVTGDDEPRGVLRGLKYEFDLEHRDGEWRIVRLVHEVMWATAAPRSGPTGEPPTS